MTIDPINLKENSMYPSGAYTAALGLIVLSIIIIIIARILTGIVLKL